MEIKTGFEVGDILYHIGNHKVEELKIDYIEIRISNRCNFSIIYHTRSSSNSGQACNSEEIGIFWFTTQEQAEIGLKELLETHRIKQVPLLKERYRKCLSEAHKIAEELQTYDRAEAMKRFEILKDL